MANITINESTCIKCERCVKVCPSGIFSREGDGFPTMQHPEYCIVCGHCAAVCPTGSVIHQDFPADRTHSIDRSALPSPEQVMLLCRSRRSSRAFTKEQVPTDMLDMILEAAHRAPTASNAQQIGFTLITDPEKLRKISSLTIKVFSSIADRLSNPIIKPIAKLIIPNMVKQVPRLRLLEEEFTKGKDRILRGATAVILIHAPQQSRYAMQDANLAYQNGSLMAESLGVGQVYTGFVYTAIEQNAKMFSEFIPDGRKIYAGMALGMPEFSYPKYIDKKDISVTKM